MSARRDTATTPRAGAAAVPLAAALATTLAAALLTCVPATARTGQALRDAAERRAAPSPASTIRFKNARDYVVTARAGGRVVRGTGRLPRGFDRRNVRVRPAKNVLGTPKVEVLIQLGPIASDPLARAWTLHTLHRGKLRPVRLGKYPLMLVNHTEGGDDVGFRCRRGQLLAHWFNHGMEQGQVSTYRLSGVRVRHVSDRPITRPVASRPASCA